MTRGGADADVRVDTASVSVFGSVSVSGSVT